MASDRFSLLHTLISAPTFLANIDPTFRLNAWENVYEENRTVLHHCVASSDAVCTELLVQNGTVK